MKIAVVDSGLNRFDATQSISIKGINFCNDSEITNYEDNIGHGTAIVDILIKNNSDIELFIVKVFDTSFTTDFDIFLKGIEYIYDETDCDMVLISSGIKQVDNHNKLYDIIDRMNKKDIVVISAFDNLGGVSYPAAYDNVIGVDIATKYNNKNSFDTFENSIVNVSIAKKSYRVHWNVPKINIVSGTPSLEI